MKLPVLLFIKNEFSFLLWAVAKSCWFDVPVFWNLCYHWSSMWD